MSKRKAETQVNTCSICLSESKTQAGLDGCVHTFCRKCIVKWSKTSTTCPECRAEFTEVKTKRSTKKVKRARQRSDETSVDDYILEIVSRFISSHSFKVMLASRFIIDPDPAIYFICRTIRHLLNDGDFIEQVQRTHEGAGQLLESARRCIETMYSLAPGSEANPISITI